MGGARSARLPKGHTGRLPWRGASSPAEPQGWQGWRCCRVWAAWRRAGCTGRASCPCTGPSRSCAGAAVPRLLCGAAIAAGQEALQCPASNPTAQDAAATSQPSTATGQDAPVPQHSSEGECFYWISCFPTKSWATNSHSNSSASLALDPGSSTSSPSVKMGFWTLLYGQQIRWKEPKRSLGIEKFPQLKLFPAQYYFTRCIPNRNTFLQSPEKGWPNSEAPRSGPATSVAKLLVMTTVLMTNSDNN